MSNVYFMKPSVHGVGFRGSDIPIRIGGKLKPSYNTWVSMLRRCYDAAYKTRKPTYNDCSVCDSWHNYTTFDKWFSEHHIDGCELDKDLLIYGNKTYSPDTCVFVPREINMILVNKKSCRGKYPQGVSFRTNRNKFVAQIAIQGKQTGLGYFEDPLSAYIKYRDAKLKYVESMVAKFQNVISEKVANAIMITAHAQLPLDPL